MESQFFIAEAIQLFDDEKPQSLITGKTRSAGGCIGPVCNQNVVDQGAGFGNLVQNITDFSEFSGVFVGGKWIDNRQLLLYLVS